MERSKNALTNHAPDLNFDDFVELFLAVSSYRSQTTYINPTKLYTASISDNYLRILDYMSLIYFACRSDLYENGLYELNIIDNKDNIWMRLLGDESPNRYLSTQLKKAMEKFEHTYLVYPLYSEPDEAYKFCLGEELTENIFKKYDYKLIADMNNIYDMYTILSSNTALELCRLKLKDQVKIIHNKMKVKS